MSHAVVVVAAAAVVDRFAIFVFSSSWPETMRRQAR